jgi:hypothetical protein
MLRLWRRKMWRRLRMLRLWRRKMWRRLRMLGLWRRRGQRVLYRRRHRMWLGLRLS